MQKNKEVTVIGCDVQDISDNRLGRLDLFFDSSIPKDLLVGVLFNLIFSELCVYNLITFNNLLNEWIDVGTDGSYEFRFMRKEEM